MHFVLVTDDAFIVAALPETPAKDGQRSPLTPMAYRHVVMVLNRCTTSDNETVVGAGPCACPETERPRGAALQGPRFRGHGWA